MTAFAVAWLCSAIVFFAIDFVWLAYIAKTFYRSRIGHLMTDRIRTGAAMLFYVIYIGGIVWFAVLDATSWHDAALSGALFGFFCYTTYDLTNYATLRAWPLSVVIVDISWGIMLTAGTAAAGYTLAGLIA